MTIQTIPTPETIKVLASGHSQIHPTPVKSQIEDRPQKRKDCNWRKPKDLPVGFWGRDSASLMADYGWIPDSKGNRCHYIRRRCYRPSRPRLPSKSPGFGSRKSIPRISTQRDPRMARASAISYQFADPVLPDISSEQLPNFPWGIV